MQSFKRIGLFFLTNILVMATISIAFGIFSSFFGIQPGAMPYLLTFCLFWGMGGAFISLFMSKLMAKWMMGVQIIDPQTSNPEYRQLVNATHEFARKAGIRDMPEVGIYDSPEINAFATGPTKNNSLVAVSSGLLQNLNKEEIEGVLGHEVAHIANGDMVTMTLIQGIVNAFAMFFSRIVARLLSESVDEKLQGIVNLVLTIVFDILFTILGSIVVNYFSRAREFRADAGGARYAGRDKMIAGLRKLKSQYEFLSSESSSENMATLKISSKQTGLMALFSTHPDLDARIEALEKGVYFK